MLRVVRAARYVLPFREGGSVPALVEGDDMGMYVVKLRGAGQGAKALVAELVSGELGRALGLPVPELVLVDLDATIAASEPDPELAEPLERSVGYNIGLDFLPGSITFDPVADPAPDTATASRTVLFDAFVLNVDRTPRNPNLLSWHGGLWLIDHGASLYFHHGWGPNDRLTASRDPFAEVRHHVLLPWASTLHEAAGEQTAMLTNEVLTRVVQEIPASWLGSGGDSADEELDRDAYVRWLRARRAAIPLLVEEAERARALLV
jgi:hypothetical protein